MYVLFNGLHNQQPGGAIVPKYMPNAEICQPVTDLRVLSCKLGNFKHAERPQQRWSCDQIVAYT
jgi:hypothetical protein